MDDLPFQYHTVNCLDNLYKHQIFGHTMDETCFYSIEDSDKI